MTELDRKKSRWPMVAASLVLVPVLYALSFGPVFWLMDHTRNHHPIIGLALDVFYWPLLSVLSLVSENEWIGIGKWVKWYVELWVGKDPF